MNDRRVLESDWLLWLSRLVLGIGLVGAVFVIVSVAKAPKRARGRAADDWQTLFSESFESGIGGSWTVRDESDDDGGSYTWATNTFLSSSPSHSVWCVGGGEDGADQLVAGEDIYPSNVDSWLIHGPVDLSGASDARLRFDWWLETGGVGGAQRPWASLQTLERINVTPEKGDWLGWCILRGEDDLDGASCTYVSGSTGNWVSAALPLDDYLRSKEGAAGPIWIAFRFVSDDDGVGGWGAFVDDVMVEVRRERYELFFPHVRKEPRPTPTPTPTPTATPSPTPTSSPVPADLENGGFEADWSEEESHRVLVIPADGSPYEKDVGNIFTPPHWLTWFYHDPGVWDQPEVRDAWNSTDPRRVHEGEKGMVMFTFYRRHDGGFLQRVRVEPGTRLRLTGWAHAWSNWQEGPHPDDPLWSEGPGYDCGFALEGEAPNGDWRNFTFRVGIDPTGGLDPYADTVKWGRGAHIYNCYHKVPAVEVDAKDRTVTVFLHSRTLWPFKHNDAYWDDVTLEVIR